LQLNYSFFAKYHGKNDCDQHFSQISRIYREESKQKHIKTTEEFIAMLNDGFKKSFENSKLTKQQKEKAIKKRKSNNDDEDETEDGNNQKNEIPFERTLPIVRLYVRQEHTAFKQVAVIDMFKEYVEFEFTDDEVIGREKRGQSSNATRWDTTIEKKEKRKTKEKIGFKATNLPERLREPLDNVSSEPESSENSTGKRKKSELDDSSAKTKKPKSKRSVTATNKRKSKTEELLAETEAPEMSSVIITKFTPEELQKLDLEINTLEDYVKVSGISFEILRKFCLTVEDRFIITFATAGKALTAIQGCQTNRAIKVKIEGPVDYKNEAAKYPNISPKSTIDQIQIPQPTVSVPKSMKQLPKPRTVIQIPTQLTAESTVSTSVPKTTVVTAPVTKKEVTLKSTNQNTPPPLKFSRSRTQSPATIQYWPRGWAKPLRGLNLSPQDNEIYATIQNELKFDSSSPDSAEEQVLKQIGEAKLKRQCTKVNTTVGEAGSGVVPMDVDRKSVPSSIKTKAASKNQSSQPKKAQIPAPLNTVPRTTIAANTVASAVAASITATSVASSTVPKNAVATLVASVPFPALVPASITATSVVSSTVPRNTVATQVASVVPFPAFVPASITATPVVSTVPRNTVATLVASVVPVPKNTAATQVASVVPVPRNTAATWVASVVPVPVPVPKNTAATWVASVVPVPRNTAATWVASVSSTEFNTEMECDDYGTFVQSMDM
jgi:hypothetical protein